MKVSGFPHCQGRGALRNVSTVREHPINSLAGRLSHPTCLVAHIVEQQYSARIPILGDPGRSVPQEEGGGFTFLNCRVYFLGETSQCLCGVRIHGINQIWLQHGLVIAGNGSVSREEKYARYVKIVGTRLGGTPMPAMVRG